MNIPFASGRAPLVGRGVVYPVPIPLDPVVFRGALVNGLDPDDNRVKLYYSDGTSWTRSIFDTEITEQIERFIDDLFLNGFDEENMPDPTLTENLRRYAFNNTRGLPGFVWENEWKYLTDEARVAEIAEDVAANVARILDEQLEWTVGAGGDYATLGEALTAAGAYTPAITEFPWLIRITILTGTTLSEMIVVRGVDLSFVVIEAEDVSVPISQSGMAAAYDPQSNIPAIFLRVDGAVGPRINFVYRLDYSWASGQEGIDDIGYYGLNAINNGQITIDENGGIENFTVNASANQGGEVLLQGSAIRDARISNVRAWRGGAVYMRRGATVRGSINTNISIANGGNLFIYPEPDDDDPVDVRRVEGLDATAEPWDIGIQGGSRVVISQGNALGAANMRPNTYSSQGSYHDVRFGSFETAGLVLRSSDTDTGELSTINLAAVLAAGSSRADGAASLVTASANSRAQTGRTAVIASDGGLANSSESAVIASFQSSTGGASKNAVIGSSACEASANSGSVIAARRVINNANRSLAMGNSNTGDPLTANRTIHLFSDSGNISIAGSLTSSHSFADFAEMFANATGVEIPLGTIVTEEGGAVRPAGPGDEIAGVVTATAVVTAGDTPFAWQGRYLSDEWGRPVMQEIADPDHEGNDPAPMIQARVENPDWNPDAPQVPRSERPDQWTRVGLLGQVFTRVAEGVSPGDRLSADDGIGVKSTERTGLRCMTITQAYDAEKGYAVARCLVNVMV